MAELYSLAWWALILVIIGVLAIGTVVLNLFSNVGEGGRRVRVTARCRLDSPDFLLALSGLTNAPLHSGGTARLLNNGDEFFPAMLEAIREARESINFTTYIWKDGQVSEAFFDALIARAEAGVAVRVLVDAFGGLRAPRRRIAELERAGGHWERFNWPRFGTLTRIHKRTHRRALLIDGRIGFTGGAAIMDKWLGDAEDRDHWRDCMVEVRGRVALSLQSAFTQLWAQTTGELITGPEYYPADAYKAERESEGEPIGRHINFISSPSRQAHPMRHVFWLSIQSAQEYVYITNAYFVPDRTLKELLKERARSGLDLRILVPNKLIDVGLIRWASHSYYDELLEAGVRIYEYQPTMIHQKVLVADGTWSLVGSVNMDVRSKELNQENALGILDRGFAAELERTFFADLESAVEIELQRWRRRFPLRRIPERFFRLFEEQL